MPLQDHFHAPLAGRRHWHSFHHAWATTIAFSLNAYLPKEYFAEPNVQFNIEIDVATLEEPGLQPPPAGTAAWQPPAPVLTVPFTIITDIIEVRVYRDEGGFVLAGAIELVSPANKDRPASRDAFVSKCASFVQQGVGLIVVDVVTERAGNFYNELMTRLQIAAPTLSVPLYAAAFRPIQRDGQTQLDVWPQVLAIGSPLPTMPLGLRGGICLPIDLEATYDRTCRELRITANGA